MPRDLRRLPPINLLTIIIEFAIIIGFSIAVTAPYLEQNPDFNLSGYEAEYLTSSATFASHSLEKHGYLPLWEPYLSKGEPLLDAPFSFILNPISIIPSLMYGSRIGIRVSVVLTAIIAGLGGWALARTLGLGSLSRILLGLLLVGKGNMVAMIGQGLFQLGASQAYIAWVIAGVIGILRLKHQRLPVILTAVAFSLMFWAGNIYYLLPTVMIVIGLGITHIFGTTPKGEAFRFTVDRTVLSRFVGAGVLTILLSAVTLLPIVANQAYVGGHPREPGAGAETDILTISAMFFADSRSFDVGALPGEQSDYQSFVLPFWYALLAFIVFPAIALKLARPAKSDMWKVASVGLFMIVFCLLWGTGHNPIIGWLYDNVSLIAQWRFVGRLLAIVSFWIAVLAAMQVDSLWQAVRHSAVWRRIAGVRYEQVIRYISATVIIVTSLIAAIQVLSQWSYLAGPSLNNNSPEDRCVEWLRQQYPDQELSVWTLGYGTVTSYLLNDVRHNNIAASYLALGKPSTVFDDTLMNLFPNYAVAWDDNDRNTLREQGYLVVLDSPMIDPDNHCLWHKADAIPYAFTASYQTLQTMRDRLMHEDVTPVSLLYHYPDQMAIAVDSLTDEESVLAVQEVAYPGWQVRVDNQPAKLESVGELLGVVIPPNSGTHFVTFAYRPTLFYIGAIITLISAAICVIYLLRLDDLIPRAWKLRMLHYAKQTGAAGYQLLTSTELFEPRHLPAPTVLALPEKVESPDGQPAHSDVDSSATLHEAETARDKTGNQP